MINSVVYSMPGGSLEQEERALIDSKYGFLPPIEAVRDQNLQGDIRRRELYEWLKRETNL